MDDRQLSQLVRDMYPASPVSSDLASIERRARQLSNRRRARKVLTGAAAFILAIGGVVVLRNEDRDRLKPTDSTTPQSTTLTTDAPPTSTTATTAPTSAPLTAGTSLLGAQLEPGAVPRFVSTDPAWTLTAFTETTDSGPGDGLDLLILVGDGPFWDAPRLALLVGGPGWFDREDGSSLGAIQEFAIGGEVGRYREALPAHGGFEFTWTLPDGAEVWAASTGLAVDDAVALLSLVAFQGTTATIEPPPGFSVVPHPPPTDGPTFQMHEFTGDVALFHVQCSYGTWMLGYPLAHQPTQGVAIAGTHVGVRLSALNDEATTNLTPLSMSNFGVGDWYCQTTLSPPMTATPLPPSNEWATDDEIRTLLASLVLVDEGTFRDVVAPLPAPQIGNFSIT